MQKIRFVDLFAGIGGMRLAFEQATRSLNWQAKCVLSSEISADARLVYQQNFGEVPLGDIRKIKKLPPHDVLLAGFPCQSFSYAGRKAGFGDTRGTLFFEITRLIDTYQPQAFIFENVRGLLTNNEGRTIETIEHEIKSRGYSFDIFLLDSSDFDLPQNRLRVYLVGILAGNPQFKLISPGEPPDSLSYQLEQLSVFDSLKKSTIVADILEYKPDEKYNCSSQFVNALKRKFRGDLDKLHGMRLIDRQGNNSIHSWELGLRGQCGADEIELMNSFILKQRNSEFGPGRDRKLLSREQIATFFDRPNLDILLDSLVAKNYLQKIRNKYKNVGGNFSFEVYRFLDVYNLSVTLVASDANRLGVYYNHRVRKITPREAARLQGFPDSFILHSNDDKAYYQMGNSVSINVVKAVAKEVIFNIK